MPRADLMALTNDDLVTLSNRGLVKRAVQEIEAGGLAWEMDEDDAGGVTVRWSDEVVCLLPAGEALAGGQCTCTATTLCRHLLRSVLVYQKRQALAPQRQEADLAGAPGPPALGTVVWDPGTIPDDELNRQISKATLARSRRLGEEGQVVELARTRKPTATIHTLSCTVRFMVPGDVRYTHCDCAETVPCSHVALAVWAFRRLRPGATGGLVSTHVQALPIPELLLDETEAALRELVTVGLSGTAKASADRLRRLEARCRAEGLVWPAEVLREIGQQWESYAGEDARFSPPRVAELAGELCMRLDAIRHERKVEQDGKVEQEGKPNAEEAIPPLFVRGASGDRMTDVGSARLVGIGCGALVRRGAVEIAAYLQDMDSGMVVAVSRDFPDAPSGAPDPPRSFAALARTPVLKGVSLAALGSGQLLARAGKRTAEGRFLVGRSPASFQPQAFAWESLRSPTLAEDFAELTARLAARPPASLSPRRVAQSLYICPLSRCENARFLPAEQVTAATLLDRTGGRATLRHPYLSRGEGGGDILLERLQEQPESLRFIAGMARAGESGPVIAPLSLVFEEGGSRSIVQPWVDSISGQTPTRPDAPPPFPAAGTEREVGTTRLSGQATWAAYFEELSEQLGELFLTGLERTTEGTTRMWENLAQQGAALGFSRMLAPIRRLAAELDHRRHSTNGDARAAAEAALQAAVLLDMVREQLPPDMTS